MWIIPDDDFVTLLERVATFQREHYSQGRALRILLEDGGAVDIRRIARYMKSYQVYATETMRAMQRAGFVKKKGDTYRFAFRGARRI